MKKFICILMILVLAFSLFACSNGDDSDKKDNDKNVGKVDKADDNTVTEQKKPERSTIEETVLVDEGGLKVTALSIEYDYMRLYTGVNLLIENNMGCDITLHCWEGSVNGYALEPGLATEVKNGESANDTVYFYNSAIERCDIETISYFEFKFRATHGSYDRLLTTDMLMLKTSAYDTYKIDYNVDGNVIYDKNGIKIVAKDVLVDEKFSHIFVENKSGKNIYVEENDAFINSVEVWSMTHNEYIPNDRYGVILLEYSDDDMEENNITEVNEIKVSFDIKENIDKKIDTTELVTLTP